MRRTGSTALVALLAAALAVTAGCRGGAAESGYDIHTGGSAEKGRMLIRHYACGSCHTIPGVSGAHGLVAPPLNYFAKRTFIAGQLPNTSENLVRWITDPPSVEPGTAMPDLGVEPQQARDIAAYLYTLR